MTNPPNTEGLTAEQIKTLRFIAEHPLVIEEDSDNFYSADYLNVCGFVDVADGAWRINHAGRVVLATIDRLIDTERERVLAEHAHSVQFAVETCEAIAGDSRIERVAPHLWADASRAEQRLRPLLAAAAPQENNQEGAG